jgi:hypothetical protein
MKNIHNIVKTTKLFAPDTFKLLTLKNIEAISKRFQDIVQLYEISVKRNAGQTSCLQVMKESALDRLAQQLEISFQYGFTSCKKQEVRGLFVNKCFGNMEETENLLSMVLSC